MRLSKERKIYVALFGLGLIALAADRLFFTPAGASAASPEPGPDAPAPTPPASPQPAPESAPGPSFAERLDRQAKWQDGPLQDAFFAPAAWVNGQSSPEAPAEARPESSFRDKHHVTAVARVSGNAMAIIDGKPVRIGESLDGFTLADIEDAHGGGVAIFERDGARLRIEVCDKAAAAHKPDKPGP